MNDAADMWICPECGAEVRVGARGCPRCARKSRQQTKPAGGKGPHRSWEQDEGGDGLDLPGADDFDYDDFVAREFGGKPHRRVGVSWWWWLTALLLLASVAWMVWHGLW